MFKEFVQAGIGDLVLDLRYNGGGYLVTEEVLASMLAPVSVVEAGKVLFQDIYNSKLAAEIKEDPTCFDTEFRFMVDGKLQVVSTAGANPDLPRLYVLVTGSSASASESLVCCLRPYMDVILIGEQTSGKYCAGYLMEARNWYDAAKTSLGEEEYAKALPYVDNWGIYVMYSRYADCNGVTLSMPDGIAPDYDGEDDPLDGCALGDPRETMLAFALGLIEGRTRSAETSSVPPPCRLPSPHAGAPRGPLLTCRYFLRIFARYTQYESEAGFSIHPGSIPVAGNGLGRVPGGRGALGRQAPALCLVCRPGAGCEGEKGRCRFGPERPGRAVRDAR